MKFLAILTATLASLVSVEATTLGLFSGLFSGSQRCNFYAVAPSCAEINNQPFYYNKNGGLTIGGGQRVLYGYYDIFGVVTIRFTSIWDFIFGIKGLIIHNGRFLLSKTGNFCQWKVNGQKHLTIGGGQNCYACQEDGQYKVFWGTNYQCEAPVPMTVKAIDC